MADIPLIKQQFEQRLGSSGNHNAIKIRKTPIMLWPMSIENAYSNELISMVNETYRMMRRKLETLRLPAKEIKINRPDSADSIVYMPNGASYEIFNRTDDIGDDIADLMTSVRVGFGDLFPDDDLEEIARNIANDTDAFNSKQIRKVIAGMVGADPFIPEPWLEREINIFVRQNVALIKSIPEQWFNQTEEIIFRGFRQGLRFEEMIPEIRDRYGKTKRRAELIARDQIGKLNGQLTQLRQQSLGIDKYIWRTVGDSRVRPEHRAREGKIFKWNSPPPDGHPGEAIQCRCWAEPVLAPILNLPQEGVPENE